jgi:dihydroxy-acid dehydratase
VPLTLKDFDEIARAAPLLVNLMPSGKYLMEDFCYAGGAPAVAKELGPLYRRDAVTVSGKTQGEIADAAKVWNREVIGSLEAPIGPSSGVWVLRGNLCPQGAILKPSAATPALLTHRGRAVVFESIEDYHARIDDPDLEVDETSILVLKGCGPKGYPGMPEVGNMGLPPKLLEKGVTDMVRISDARMSGTAYGTVILHVAPEAEAGGPLALVQNGDEIAFDGPNRTLELLVDEAELARRRTAWDAARQPSKYTRGWYRLYIDTVLQADAGVDLDFLVGKSSADVTRESH